MAEYHVGALQTYSTIQAALDVALAAGDIVTVHGGNYSEALASRAAGITLRKAAEGSVTIDCAGKAAPALNVTHINFTIRGSIQLTGADSGIYNLVSNTTGFVADGVVFSGGNFHARWYQDALFIRCTFGPHTQETLACRYHNTSGKTVKFQYCVFDRVYAALESRLGDMEIDHCVFIGCKSRPINLYANTGAKSITVRNSAIIGCNWVTDRGVITNESTGNGTLAVGGTYVSPSTRSTATYGIVGAYTDLGGNILSGLPGYRASKQNCYISFEVDDAINAATYAELSTRLESRGWRGTWQIDTANVPNWDVVRGHYAKGHEIASHTRHHTNVRDLQAFTILAPSACTLSIDVAADSLTTSLGLSLTLSSYASVGALAAALSAAGYTVVCSATQPSQYANAGMTLSLADISNVSIGSVYTVLYDRVRHLAEELDGSILDLEREIPGIEDITFCPPGHNYSADIEPYVRAAGFIGARWGKNNEYLSTGVNIFRVQGVLPRDIITNVERDVPAYIELYKQVGGIICFYIHGTIDIGGTGWDTLEQIFDVVEKSGAIVLPRNEAIKRIIAAGTTGDSITYTVADVSPDYRLAASSRLVHGGLSISGVNDSGQIDYFGSAAFVPHPNIGADQYDYAPGFGPWTPFDSTMPPLTLAPDCPGKLKQVQEWKTAVTKKQIDGVSK